MAVEFPLLAAVDGVNQPAILVPANGHNCWIGCAIGEPKPRTKEEAHREPLGGVHYFRMEQ